MVLLMLATSVILLIFLVLTAAMRPVRSPLSLYELRRRQKAGDPVAAGSLHREELLPQAEALRRLVTALLLVAFALMAVASLGWPWGAVAAVTASVMYGRLADVPLMRKLAQKLYRRREEVLLRFVDRHKKKLSLLTGKSSPHERESTFGSREELFHLVSESGAVLSPDDKKLLTHALAFTQRRASDIMTAREDIVAIEHTELLGPLVLSDLHKTGHSCFPVIVGDLDHIVGTLDIRELLTLEMKRSLTAAKAMAEAYYIRGEQTLDHSLATFVRTRHHLLAVIDEEGATLGLLSLRDVLEALFGRSMADEFASDADLHLVAKRHL